MSTCKTCKGTGNYLERSGDPSSGPGGPCPDCDFSVARQLLKHFVAWALEDSRYNWDPGELGEEDVDGYMWSTSGWNEFKGRPRT